MIKHGTVVHVIHGGAVVSATVMRGSATGHAARVALHGSMKRIWLPAASIFSNREAALAALTNGPRV